MPPAAVSATMPGAPPLGLGQRLLALLPFFIQPIGERLRNPRQPLVLRDQHPAVVLGISGDRAGELRHVADRLMNSPPRGTIEEHRDLRDGAADAIDLRDHFAAG